MELVAQLPAAMAAFVGHAEKMVHVNSNQKGGGGSELFKAARAELKLHVDELIRLRALQGGTLLHLWQTMPTNVMKTPGSWRVHVLAMLREVDYCENRFRNLLRKTKLTTEDVDEAMQTGAGAAAVLAIADAPQRQRQRQQRSAGQHRHRSSGPAGGGSGSAQAALPAGPGPSGGSGSGAQAALPAGPAAMPAAAPATGGEAATAPATATAAPPSVPLVSSGAAGGGGWALARCPAAPAASGAAGGIQRFFAPLPRRSCGGPGQGPGAAGAAGGAAGHGIAAGTSASASASAGASTGASGSAGSAAPPSGADCGAAAAAADAAGGAAAGGAAAEPPPSAAGERWDARDPEGFYRVLQVSPDATDRDIGQAYKRQALRWHPDKPTGDTQEFQRVVFAYEFLSDVAKRAAYGRSAGNTDRPSPSPPPPPPAAASAAESRGDAAEAAAADAAAQAAKAFYAHLVLAPEEAWPRVLLSASGDVLVKLEELGYPRRCRCSAPGGPPGPPDPPAGDSVNAAGLKFRPKSRDFFVQVGWRNFKVKPAGIIRELDHAVDLHIALLSARNTAKARFAALERSAPFLGPAGSLDACVPLTDAEHWVVLSEAPFVPLAFASDITVPGAGRKQTPWTTSLNDALAWRLVVRQGLERRELEAVNVAKREMAGQAVEHRKAAIASRDRAMRRIREELKRRGVATPRGGPPAPPGGVAAAALAPPPAAAGPLALKNEAAAEEIARLQRAVEEERAGKFRAIEDGQRALEDAHASKLQAIEDGQRALDDERAAKQRAQGAQAAAEVLAERFAMDVGRERETRARLEHEARQARGAEERLRREKHELQDELLQNRQEMALAAAARPALPPPPPSSFWSSSGGLPRFRRPPPEAPEAKRARLLEETEKDALRRRARQETAEGRAWLAATDPR